jgi:hypothetical protein
MEPDGHDDVGRERRVPDALAGQAVTDLGDAAFSLQILALLDQLDRLGHPST